MRFALFAVTLLCAGPSFGQSSQAQISPSIQKQTSQFSDVQKAKKALSNQPEGEWGDEAPPLGSPQVGLEIPTHNVDAMCGMLSSTQAARHCVQEEQISYNRLKEIWPNVDERTKKESLLDAKGLYDTPRYYRVLLDFMLGRLAAAQLRREQSTVPRFQR